MELDARKQKPSRFYDIAVLLTLAGGFLDAYTYASRGGVFANAQTGNTVKLGIFLANGQYRESLRFLVPILAFFLGTVLAIHVETEMERRKIHFIRRGILLAEMVIALLVSFLPQEQNMTANALVSLLCAMQMESFRSFVGQPITTTVATGNLRKFVENLYKGIANRDSDSIKASGYYISTVMIFVLGAFIGTLLTRQLGTAAIALVLVPYALAFVRITHRKKQMKIPFIG